MAYPTDLPLVEIQNIINLVRNGQAKDHIKNFAHDLWIVQGYAMGIIIGKPESLDSSDLTNFDAIATLERLCNTNAGISAQSAIPWNLLISWILKMLQELFDELGKN